MSARRSVGGGAKVEMGRYAKVLKSKQLADDRAVEKRKQEGKMIFEYTQLLKSMGMEESQEFKDRKAEYQKKLEAEKDKKHVRQAKKRKRAEEENRKKEEELQDGSNEEGEEDPENPAKKKITDPLKKKELAFNARKKEAEDRRKKWAAEDEKRRQDIAKSNKQRQNRHLKLQQKTKRGQPIMANKMDYLMHKINKSVGAK
eukprot:TRINITY_DN21784_c0_g1_i1.p1 TRINITY_DN21784_c0_g1~~TRINITY_DN21784_c0_g1_i1.p1  ORF type:complete len:220 (+),score=83.16 TRINITY_DN21784_c0_g1_i1:60-662(+)